eukprot:727706-Rhodomonas_salina.2
MSRGMWTRRGGEVGVCGRGLEGMRQRAMPREAQGPAEEAPRRRVRGRGRASSPVAHESVGLQRSLALRDAILLRSPVTSLRSPVTSLAPAAMAQGVQERVLSAARSEASDARLDKRGVVQVRVKEEVCA